MRVAIVSPSSLSGWHHAAVDLELDFGFYEFFGALNIVAKERGRANILVIDLTIQDGGHPTQNEIVNLVDGVGASVVIITGRDYSPSIFRPLYPVIVGNQFAAENLGSLVVQRVGVMMFGRRDVELTLPVPITGPDGVTPWASDENSPWIKRASDVRGLEVSPQSWGYDSAYHRGLSGEGPLVLRTGRPGLFPEVPHEASVDDHLHKGVFRQDLEGHVELLELPQLLALKGYAPLPDGSPLLSWDLLLALTPVAVCAEVLMAQLNSLAKTRRPIGVGENGAHP